MGTPVTQVVETEDSKAAHMTQVVETAEAKPVEVPNAQGMETAESNDAEVPNTQEDKDDLDEPKVVLKHFSQSIHGCLLFV